MNSSKRGAIIVLIVLGAGVFGYSQYASASQIEVSVARSELLNTGDDGSDYDIELEFRNPSLLILAAGKTEFFIIAGDRTVGSGELEPFTLQPLDSSRARGTFHTDSYAEGSQAVKIAGTTKYDVLFASFDVPFVFYPTDEQTREFIRGG